MTKRRDVLKSGLALLPLIAPGPVWAQAKYPERPIKLMITFSPGGVNDVVGRHWAERMKPLLGAIYVENQAGASGSTGTAEVARTAADGHTILLGTTSTMVLNPMTMARVPYDPAKDFLPVAILCVSTTSVVVHQAVPVKSLKELIAYVKGNPGKLSYGSAGTGTLSNLAGELFKQLTGLSDLQHISYRGAGPGITDLVAGHIPIMTPNITGQVLELHRTGKVRVLTVNSAERLAAAPEIPTAIEEGLPNMIAQLFLGIFVHANTPKPIVAQIAEANRRAMADPSFQKILDDAGLEPVHDSNTEKAQRFLAEEIARWGPVVKASGFKM
jgi:tripartite-type tricarboxylate transporter receptor subunit TctC